jgi:glucose/arabinose dehydrogenase
MILLAQILTTQNQNPRLPAVSKSTILVPKLVPAPESAVPGSFLKPAPGYAIESFATGLKHPRMIAIAPNHDVFVVQSRIEVKEKNQPHEVVVLSQFNSQGKPTQRTTWSNELDMPFGIQFGFGHLYVANTGSVVRWRYQNGQIEAQGKPETILDGIPNNGYRNHWTRNILFDAKRQNMYLTIGSELNLAEEGPRRAVIEKYSLDSSGKLQGKPETFATGLRNPIGLALNPTDGRLWTNVAERDYKGDNLVPDFLTSVKRGGFYGWPYCYIGKHHDPKMPRRPELEERAIVPEVLYPAHSTPIDIKFIDQGAVVALHGSQNRSRLNGYKVILIPFDKKGKPSGKPQDLVTGWLPKGSNKAIYGRPAGLAIMADGSILITDDWAGCIWRLHKK